MGTTYEVLPAVIARSRLCRTQGEHPPENPRDDFPQQPRLQGSGREASMHLVMYALRPVIKGGCNLPRRPARPSSWIISLVLILVQGHSWARPAAQMVHRVTAWGDLNYAVTLNNVPASQQNVLAQIAAGDFHSLALQNDGSIAAWGDDSFGQVDLPNAIRLQPVIQVAAGNIHSLALLADGTVTAWGPAPGQYGDYGQCTVPPGLGQVAQIAAGAVHSLALRTDGSLSAWGSNLYGQCNAPSSSDMVAVAGGMYHSVALRPDGTVVVWGDFRHAQTAVPPGLTNVVAIAAGGFHTLALRSDGTVLTWGTYGLAQCSPPIGLSNVVAIATGDYHSLALKTDGTVVAWGFNTAGQCNVPTGLTNVEAIAARGNHSMVLFRQAVTTSQSRRSFLSQ